MNPIMNDVEILPMLIDEGDENDTVEDAEHIVEILTTIEDEEKELMDTDYKIESESEQLIKC